MEQTYYQILGVGQGASPDEIRKRFRELARKYHPDVNHDKDSSHQAFVRITEAYQVLNDPVRRADYDLMLRDRARRQAERGRAGTTDQRRPTNDQRRGDGATGRRGDVQSGGATTARPRPGPGGATARPRPGPNPPPPPNVGYRPGGPGASAGARGASAGSRTRGAQDAGAATRRPWDLGEPPPRSSASRPYATRTQEASRFVREAQAAYAGLRYRDSIRLCKAALEADPQNGVACSLLGDIYRGQGRIDDAIHYYSLAVQLCPVHQKHVLMTKLEDLMSRDQRRRPRPAPQPEVRAATREALATSARRRASRQVAVGAFGVALTVMLSYVSAEMRAEPLTTLPWIAGWTAPMLWGMLLSGLLLGMTLALMGAIRPMDEELFLTPLNPGRIGGPPLGLLLFVSGALFFYLALGIHLLIRAMQDDVSRSVTRVFIATFVFVCCYAALYPPEVGRQVLLLGGNVVFVSMLLGWLIGDLFRPIGG